MLFLWVNFGRLTVAGGAELILFHRMPNSYMSETKLIDTALNELGAPAKAVAPA